LIGRVLWRAGRPNGSLVHEAARVSAVSLAVGVVLGVVAIVLAAQSGSIALLAFGLESFIDATASGLLLWRFGVERREPDRGEEIERKARRIIGLVLVWVASYLTVAAIRALVAGTERHDSIGAVALLVVSAVILPAIAYRKLVLARQLPSRALRADGLLTAVAAVLAMVTLVAVVVNRFTDATIADPIAALLMAVVLFREAIGALRR
jgi:divalent metal cation (Fe/Co/Zn/Cd) transporter